MPRYIVQVPGKKFGEVIASPGTDVTEYLEASGVHAIRQLVNAGWVYVAPDPAEAATLPPVLASFPGGTAEGLLPPIDQAVPGAYSHATETLTPLGADAPPAPLQEEPADASQQAREAAGVAGSAARAGRRARAD